ncbi:hypothetical protein [Hymenobacter metallilatus]|uniref:Uncharacterized protein n=1 Tax=Hymenobacter metallilatus TaxID=2493666 RepID=A0A3R9M9N7_9BACT|nr:hypothetical protein [Hymenobacter metallilatus]RSK36297.1 hypothetical protein EI290_05295 [Hymenobacter metallilatus]
MFKLPSFTALFLCGIIGLISFMGATIWGMDHFYGTTTKALVDVMTFVRLLGLFISVMAPLLMLLKLFRKADNHMQG